VAAIAVTLDTFVVPIAEALHDGGWTTIATADGASQLAGFDSAVDLPAFRRRGILAHLKAFRALVRTIRVVKPDVVHLNTPAAVAMGRIAAALARVPSVSVIHGTFLEPRSWATIPFGVIETLFARMSKVTVVLNEDDARFYRRVCGKARVLIAPAGGAGIDFERSDHRPVEDQSRKVALFVGRLAGDKNLDFLVQAWTTARRACPDLVLRLVGSTLAGDPPWARPDVPGIEFAPWTDDPLSEILGATIFVSASRREGFALTVAEAVVAGVPTVVLENRGTREIERQAGGAAISVVKCDRTLFATAMAQAVSESSRSMFRQVLAERWGREATVAFHAAVVGDCFERSSIHRCAS
jgi:glycosyltransferase involved in cell wall biosynthesis